MTNIVNQIGSYPVSSTGNENIDIQNTLNNLPQQAVETGMDRNSTLNSMMISPDVMLKTALCLPPIVLADRFVNSKMTGEEDKTLLKKIANFGDKIANKLHLENFTGNKFTDFVTNNRFTKFFTTDYSANPRCSLAKFPSMTERYSNELANQLVKLKDNPQFSKLFENGIDSLSDTTKDFIKNLDPKNAKNEPAKLLQATEEILSKGIDNISKGGILSEPVNLSQMRNNLKTAQSQMGQTAIGSGLAKGALDAKRHLTFGGGILGLAFVSFAFNQAFKSASEAPEGEKISTFMHVLSEQFVGFLLFQPSISIMYRLGGNKYRGMTKEARQTLEDLVKKTNADETITKEGVKLAKLQRDLLIKGVNKDEVLKLSGKTLEEAKNIAKTLKSEGNLKLWEKPLKLLGKIFSAGLDEIKNPARLFGKKAHSFSGDITGIGRLLMIFLLIQPFLQKPVTDLCHKIFGKPQAYLDKENASEDKTSENNEEQKNPKLNNKETNLVKQWTNLPDSSGLNNTKPVESNNTTQNQTTLSKNNTNNSNNTIASTEIKEGENRTENSLYIPSIQVDNSYLGTQENDVNQRVNEILKRTDSRVAHINQSLQND